MDKHKFAKILQSRIFAKRSQITIFMIVGLFIIIGGAVFFYSAKKAPSIIEPEIQVIREQAPIEFDPIKKYADDCVNSVGVEGLKIIGNQGGYISFTDRDLNSESFNIVQNPTESDAVSFESDSELNIPYWWYLKSANSCRGECVFASKRPELRQSENSIEKQLERYVNKKFRECLNGFEPFLKEGFKVTEPQKTRTDVVIGMQDVSILVEYPLEIEKQELKSKLSQFLVMVPVNLNSIYELGAKITELEMKHRYLEKHALNLVVAFSGKSREKLPPMSDMQFNFGSAPGWRKSELKSKITGMLSSYISLFQVDGTYNYERNIFDSELKQRLYDSSIIPVANDSFNSLAPYFTYLDFWPIYFDLNCKGERCVPSSGNSLLSFFGIQDYRFAYDLSFPVLVEIQDPFALNEQGYSFRFFIEGNIRNNKPMPADFAPLERAALSEKSLLCDSKTSGNITIKSVNAATKFSIDDAQVIYTVTGESCFIGATDSEGELKEQFPVGVGGIVSIAKNGYIGKTIEFDPKADKNDLLKASMQPIYTKRIIVKKKNIVKTLQGWQFVNSPVELSEKEAATVSLTRIGDAGELDFSSATNYAGKQQDPSDIEIAAGKYSADIILILNEKIVIPEKQKCVSLLFKKQCTTIPKVDFSEKATPGQEKFPEGGLKLNFTINSKELESSDTIVFYAIVPDIHGIPEQSRVIEDIEQMGKTEEYSNIYKVALQPTFE